MSRYIEVSFLVPLRADANLGDGALHNPARWKVLHEQLYTRFGGWTCTGEVEGCYQDPDTGEEIFDESRRYVVALEETKIDEMKQVLRRAARTFAQKTMYMAWLGQVEFIEAQDDDGTLFDADEP